ncbi:hypothetical protein [Streptomyces sp. NPDC047000]|uniref:hypothetical protein n=1 Tax=Streptomyces sp. NPDC047000 TaxID=3155474 RepID=UPI0033F3C3E4
MMDEPFAALDEFTRENVQKKLLRLWRANDFSAMFITHSVPEAVTLGHRIVVMAARPLTPGAAPQRLTLDLERTAIVVVDMQNNFCAPGGRLDSVGVDMRGTAAAGPLARLLAPLGAVGVPVVRGNRPDLANLPPGVGMYTAVTAREAASATVPVPARPCRRPGAGARPSSTPCHHRTTTSMSTSTG